jgi:hypothetical protein
MGMQTPAMQDTRKANVSRSGRSAGEGHTKSVRRLGRGNEQKGRGELLGKCMCRASTECVGRNKGRVFPKQRKASVGPVHWGRPSSSKEGRNVSGETPISMNANGAARARTPAPALAT